MTEQDPPSIGEGWHASHSWREALFRRCIGTIRPLLLRGHELHQDASVTMITLIGTRVEQR